MLGHPQQGAAACSPTAEAKPREPSGEDYLIGTVPYNLPQLSHEGLCWESCGGTIPGRLRSALVRDASSTGDVSREVQERAIRDLAHRDGHNGDVEYFVDWGKSGSEAKSASWTAYQRMLQRIEEGHVSAVYAYGMDRLNRSLVMSARFAKACEANDVRIVTAREGEVRQDSPSERLRWTILATFGEYELRTISARNAHAIAERRSKGGWIGRVGIGWKLERNADGVMVRVPDPGQPLDDILEAVREAGSILGAAKRLQSRGVPTPDGKAIWGSTTLRRIVEDNAPELLPAAGPTGRRQPARSSMLAQLLRCHCGAILTPEPNRRSYRCRVGVRQGSAVHGLTLVPERAILDWVKREASRFRVPGDVAQIGVRDDERRASVTERRRRLALAFAGGALDDDTYRAEDRAILAEMEHIEAAVAVVDVPQTVDWDAWSPEAINAVLRAYWRAVDLGPDMRPVRADWKLPEAYWS